MVNLANPTKAIFRTIKKRDATTLHELITKYIPPGSTIVSDQWRGYLGLQNNYNQLFVNHSRYFVDPRTGKIL